MAWSTDRGDYGPGVIEPGSRRSLQRKRRAARLRKEAKIANTRKTGSHKKRKSNARGHGGRAAQLKDQGVPVSTMSFEEREDAMSAAVQVMCRERRYPRLVSAGELVQEQVRVLATERWRREQSALEAYEADKAAWRRAHPILVWLSELWLRLTKLRIRLPKSRISLSLPRWPWPRPFKIGDIVYLKSGSPPMSVYETERSYRNRIEVEWFDRYTHEMKYKIFDSVVLTRRRRRI